MPPSGPWRSGSGRMIGPLQQGDTRRGRRHRPGRHHRPVPPYPQHRLCPDGLMFVQAIHRPDYFRENTTLARVVQVRFNTSAALWFRTGYGLAGVVCRWVVSVGCVVGLRGQLWAVYGASRSARIAGAGSGYRPKAAFRVAIGHSGALGRTGAHWAALRHTGTLGGSTWAQLGYTGAHWGAGSGAGS